MRRCSKLEDITTVLQGVNYKEPMKNESTKEIIV